MIVMPQGTAIYEFVWNFQATENFDVKQTLAAAPIRVFGNYGDAYVQKYTTLLEDYFAISYYSLEKEKYIICVYYAGDIS